MSKRYRKLKPRSRTTGAHIVERDALSPSRGQASTRAIAQKRGRAALADILGVSLRTVQRKSESDVRLGSAVSDRLARVRRIQQLATHVFGEREKASVWLTSPSRALNHEIPLHLLDTDIGTQSVQQELRQIEFGMPI